MTIRNKILLRATKNMLLSAVAFFKVDKREDSAIIPFKEPQHIRSCVSIYMCRVQILLLHVIKNLFRFTFFK